MKVFKLNLTLIFILIIALKSTPETSAKIADSLVYENDSVFTIDSFKDELSNDGEWIKIEKDEVDPEGVIGTNAEYDDDINYEYVWRPYGVGPDWMPYTNGYWSYTNCGWMWTSYFGWGWRTYHYGRWWWSPVWGWVWSPGFVWAPAWVVWMYYGDYWGWYPISPRLRWHHGYGWRCHHMRYHVRHWTFVHRSHYTSPINITLIVDPPGNKNIIDKATFVNDINVENGKVINRGPQVQEIEKATGKKIVSENVYKYNNAKVITTGEKTVKEKQADSEKRYKEKQSGNEKEKYYKNEGDKKQRNDDATKSTEKNHDNEKQKSSESKSNKNEKMREERTYDEPKNYDRPEKKESYDKQKNNNSGKKEQSYESPRQDDYGNDEAKRSEDGNNNWNKNDGQKNIDSPEDKGSGQDSGNGKDNGKQKGKN